MCGLEKALFAIGGEAKLLDQQHWSLLIWFGHTRMSVGTRLM